MVGTGAGLALGIATVIRRDVMPLVCKEKKEIAQKPAVEKVLIVLILSLACALSMGPFGDTILKFAFMSMGLRGATIFIPLCFAMWRPKTVGNTYAGGAIVAGPFAVLVLQLLGKLPFDPLFAGVIISAVIMIAGYLVTKKQKI